MGHTQPVLQEGYKRYFEGNVRDIVEDGAGQEVGIEDFGQQEDLGTCSGQFGFEKGEKRCFAVGTEDPYDGNARIIKKVF